MKNHLPGITISTLVHAGLFALAWTTFVDQPVTPAREPEPIALKLAMFVPPPPPEPVIVPPEPVVAPEPEPIVEIIKKPGPPPPPKPVKKPRPKPVSRPKKNPRPKPVVHPEPTPEAKPEVAAAQPPVAPTPPPVVVDTRLTNKYKAKVRQAIEDNKHYPRKARRLRQQGTVTLAFTIRRDGSIENLRIIQSAGYHSLDQAALKAIEKINGKFPIPDDLHRESWDFRVPMKYSLL